MTDRRLATVMAAIFGLHSHLPYLRSLGVTVTWLAPWSEFINQLNQREQFNSTKYELGRPPP